MKNEDTKGAFRLMEKIHKDGDLRVLMERIEEKLSL